MNVILHTLAHVSPFRDYFLRELNYSHIKPPPGDQMFILGMCNSVCHDGMHRPTSAYLSQICALGYNIAVFL